MWMQRRLYVHPCCVERACNDFTAKPRVLAHASSNEGLHEKPNLVEWFSDMILAESHCSLNLMIGCADAPKSPLVATEFLLLEKNFSSVVDRARTPDKSICCLSVYKQHSRVSLGLTVQKPRLLLCSVHGFPKGHCLLRGMQRASAFITQV